MASQIFIWWLAAQGFGLAGLPLARFLFRALPDRGYAFAKTLGLLLAGYLAWLIAMLGLAPFGAGLIVVSALAIGVIGLLTNKEQSTKNKQQKTDTRRRFSVPGDWRLILCYEALFALALVFLALLRSYNPHPWGTERPMDFALFNAIRRSASFPPHDPWLAGYSINYYYFGYMFMAVVALVSGLEPSAAFNLSLALIFALTALGVAGVVYNLIALTENRTNNKAPTERGRPFDRLRDGGAEENQERVEERQPTADDGRWTTDDEEPHDPQHLGRNLQHAGRIAAIVLTVVLVLFAGNQGGALEVVTGAEIATALKGQQLAQAISNGLGPRRQLELDPPFKGWDFDGARVISPTNMLENFNWWWPSRAVWDDYRDPDDPSPQPARRYTITEFPFFSFWLGDMHPHVMALPFCLLALGLALQTAARPAAPSFAMGRRGWLELILTGIVLGSLYAINSWDFPTYLLLFLGALLLLHIRLGAPAPVVEPPPSTAAQEQAADDEAVVAEPTHQASPLSRVWWRLYASQAAMAGLASVVMLAPFYLTFHSLVGGKEPLVNLPILATITRTLGVVTSSRTAIYSFLLIFGLFLLPLVAYTFAQGRHVPDKETGRSGHAVSLSPDLFVWLRVLPWFTLGALIVGLLLGFGLLALLPLALYAGVLAICCADQPASAFALWAFALVCLVCFGTEIVYIRDGFEGSSARMNTIFKFYYQAWLIWGVLAGYALWWLATRSPTAKQPHNPRYARITHQASRITGAGLFGGLFVLLLGGALLYPWLTAGKTFREAQRAGLLGTTPREATPEGAASIAWLREHAPGNAVVLEAVGGSYSPEGFGGVSAASGLATVLGWPGHEDQWRGGDAAARAQIGPRQEDVKTIYSTPSADEASALLTKYKVTYIYVGQLERSTYPPESLAKFDQLGSPVFREGDVTIYQVTTQ
jgi:YYY domain-containing protein